MGVPNADPNLLAFFAGTSGVALMRHHASQNKYYFCCWCGKGGTIKIEHLGGPETYTYELWLVRGLTQTVETISITDTSTLYVVGVKK